MNNTVTRQVLGKVAMTSRGEYDTSKSYEILDIVTYRGSSYLSKKYNNDSLPTNADDWQLLAQKGDTYELSEEDLQRIAEQITSNANSTFNQNVKEKTDGFNSNANSKTEAYNTNATEKLGTYNSNHTAKLKEYNDNATSKLSDYNTNTVTKTNEYNSNHTNKLNAYDTNASNKVDTYNTNADTRLEEYNTNADNKIAEYDEHSKELNNKIVSIGNDYRMVKDQLLYTGEDTDTFIHVEDSAMAEMKEIKVDGALKQTTTTGKNKFDQVNKFLFLTSKVDMCGQSNGDIGGCLDLANYANQSLTISSQKKQTRFRIGLINQLPDKQTSQVAVSNGINLDGNEITKATINTSTFKYLVVNTNDLTQIQIETGTEATDYEPYTGGQPSPSPDYPQEIKTITDSLKITSCGKNFFSSDSLSTWKASINRISKNEFELTSAGDYSNANISFMKLKKYLVDGQEYTLSANFDNPNGNHIGFNIINISNKYTDDLNGTLSMSFTYNSLKTPSIYLYANASADASITGTVKWYNVMLTNKSLSDNYEPYIESQIQAKLPEGEFIGKLDDTYKDTLRAEYNKDDGQYHLMLDKKVGKKVFSSDDNWNRTANENDTVRFSLINNQYNLYDDYNNIAPNFKSNYFMSIPFAQSFKGKSGISWWVSEDKSRSVWVLGFGDNRTLLEFKNWLSNNQVEVYYPLAKPYTVDLGVINMPMSYKDITNIFTDSDLLPTINAKYYRVFDKTIQNAQINEKTLKQEITDLNATVSALDNRLKALENKTVEEPTESEGTV